MHNRSQNIEHPNESARRFKHVHRCEKSQDVCANSIPNAVVTGCRVRTANITVVCIELFNAFWTASGLAVAPARQ